MSVWMFWLIAAAIAAAVAAALVKSLRSTTAGNDAPDMAIYRQQLRDVERDLARGTLDPIEAERLRTEISRRVLDADRAGARGLAGRGPIAGAALAVVILLGAFGIYNHLGAPGYPDLPLADRIAGIEAMRAARPSQAEAEGIRRAPTPEPEADFIALMNRLRDAVPANPEDLRGWQLLARNELALGNFSAAADAQTKVIELDGNKPADSAALAEIMVLAANGYVSPEAERVLDQTLGRNPEEPLALYYAGLMMAQGGRDDAAFDFWRAALRVAPPDAGYVPFIRDSMPDIAARAGVRWEEPAPAPATPDIEGMVQRLNDRLATQGGSAEEWARLINAYGVLGRTDAAAAIWAEAQQIFTGESDLATLRAAATKAGLQ